MLEGNYRGSCCLSVVSSCTGKFTVSEKSADHDSWCHIPISIRRDYLRRFAAAKQRAARSIIAEAR